MSVDEVRHGRVDAAMPARSGLVLGRDFATLRHARDWAVGFVRHHRPDAAGDAVTDLRIVLDELTCNAIRHARPPYELALAVRGDRIRVEVSDAGPGLARPRTSGAGGGRGLALIGVVAACWGQATRRGGKTVWAELALKSSAG